MNITQSYISINGLRVYAHHGVLDVERKVGNEFVVDAQLSYDATRAMQTDNIDTALNYATAVDIIKKEMQQPSGLLENVAHRIAVALSSSFDCLTGGTITVAKHTPPLSAALKSTSFTLSWTV